ncbi:LysR family transcriptional regulator [Listeria grayi]|uniref:LysR family transcriptional regulator n=1 Tax=Listeria grayi TaxID=1641 RepID=UPI0016294EFC|nr:LysR family transcriptional regulator [Listeria grayi]MBC1921580.1 LysR family transcriptional regulator [Listeria grayi]
MNLKDLEYFQQVVTDRNFTEAARAYKVSQPTVTYAIKRLEEELGTKLIIRNQAHHSLIITEAGKILSAHIKKMMKELNIARTEIARLADKKIKCGLPPIIGNYYFPKLSVRLLEQGFMKSIDIISGGSRDLYQLLKTGQIDTAILGSTQAISDKELTSRLLVEKPFMIVVSPNHPLAKRESIAFSELKNEPFVLFNEHFVHSSGFHTLIEQTDFEPNIIYENSDLNILKGMIHEQIGIGFLVELAVHENDDLVSIPISDSEQPTFMISVVTRKQVTQSDYQREIVEFITSSTENEIREN